jgi:hypothetical protein
MQAGLNRFGLGQVFIIAQNSVASAEYFRLLFHAVCATLLGVPPSGSLKTTLLTGDSRRGVFGRAVNFDANLECNQRKALHFHGIFTGTLSPRLCTAIAHSPVFVSTLAKVFDSMIKAELSTKSLLQQIIADTHGVITDEPLYSAVSLPTGPDGVGGADFCTLVDASAANTKTVMHLRNHHNACVNSKRPCCRFARPAGLCECTSMRMVSIPEGSEIPAEKLTEEYFDVGPPKERPPHNYSTDPIEPIDNRSLSFEIKRPPICL